MLCSEMSLLQGGARAVTWRSIAPVPSYTMLPKMAPVSVDDTCTTNDDQAQMRQTLRKRQANASHISGVWRHAAVA